MPRRATIDDMGMGDFSSWYQPRGGRRGGDERGGLRGLGGGSSLPNGGRRRSRRKTMTSSRVGRYTGHSDGDGDDHDGDYRYGGMKELFALRRERRALANNKQTAERRWSSASDPDELFNEVAKNLGLVDCDRRIEALLRVLPIAALREKLARHYDYHLRRMQGMCEVIGGGVGRCAVELVPPPITRRGGGGPGSLGPVGTRRPPSAPSAFACLAAAEFVRSTMRERVPKLMDPRDGRLSGMCFFHRDRLVLSDFVPGGDGDGRGAMVLPLEIPCMIVEYFRSSWEGSDADDARRDVARGGITQNGNDTPLSRWRLAGAKKIDNAAQQGSSPLVGNGKHVSDGFESRKYGFVAHPYPPTDNDGPMNSLFVRSMKKHVWLKRVYLPGDVVDINDEVVTLVAMFESEELTFLLFFEMPSFSVSLARMVEELRPKTDVRSNSKGDRKSKDGTSKPISGATQAFVDVLSILAEEMTGFCNMFSPSYKTDSVSDDIASVGDIDNIFQGEPGMEIISINRDENSFVLLSQNNFSVAPPPSKQKFGLFGNGTKSKDSTDSELSNSLSKYSNMLDCRHKLAASLPLDVTLALDGIFNEIGCFTGRNDTLTHSLVSGVDVNRVNINSGVSKSIELCTFLPRGWVYGRAYGGIELYIVLDTSKFVTINDVQKAVTRIRERVFNDNIR
ncbi:hypothetical protein ACHAW5_009552 [Stephanodiscus triporus]|uniref:Uncharacterized protein n=1 Tax=Stephanodiscus triporus TaxID=2934178 RepID=A0ABD3NJJ1_9STRA